MLRRIWTITNTRSFFVLFLSRSSTLCTRSTSSLLQQHFLPTSCCTQSLCSLRIFSNQFRRPHSSITCGDPFSSDSRFTRLSGFPSSPQQDINTIMADARYCVEYAKTGRSSCKKCKSQIEKGVSRIGKITTNPFSDDGGEMKVWYHTRCMFETLKRARATTKKIESPADLDGFPDLNDPEKDEIRQLIKEFVTVKSPAKTSAKKKASGSGSGGTQTTLPGASPSKPATSASGTGGVTPSPKKLATAAIKQERGSPKKSLTTAAPSSSSAASSAGPSSRDNLFHQFRILCEKLEKEPGYNAKTKIVSNFIKNGSSGTGYTGDVYLLVKMLLPTAGKKRVYNLQSKQIVKHLSQIFGCSLDDMVEDLEQGDVAETAKKFFEDSTDTPPAKSSTLTLADVDAFLDRMATLTKEDDQRNELSKIIRRCTSDDLKFIVRLIKHDLRINAGAKHVLDALDPNAYAAFQASHDLQDVVDRVFGKSTGDDGATPTLKKGLSVRASLMTPVKPMLAEACRAVATAIKKCPNGMYAEIKYDGERVQVHKQGDKFEYFSRSLKPVQSHKVEHIKDYLPKACPHGDSMILDSEVLMVDMNTGQPLPFGTLGVHKKSAFKDACCCLFIFDIIYFNGETLMDRPLDERRKILEQNVKEVKNRIMLSEQTLIRRESELSGLIMKVIKQGLEGLVLKDTKSMYEPGKRHWLKVKKDYLAGGSMADTADLLVLGAYYGTGNKGGMMSVFLMGVYDKSRDKFCTVAKCGNGHDDATLARLQKQLDMVKISKSASKVPTWLLVNKSLIPDFVIRDPKTAPVWEITGAEFTSSTTHTAAGVSIRFPRVTKIRHDKDWKTATDLERLKVLFKTSKENLDLPDLMKSSKSDDSGENGDTTGNGDNEEEEDDDDVEDMDVSHGDRDSKASSSSARDNSRGRGASSSPAKKRKREAVEYRDDGDDDEPDSGIPQSKKRKKPLCKYGAKCYQTGARHREQFDHPWDVGRVHKLECANIKVEDPLVDLFTGVKVFIQPDVKNAEELRRYFISYDGEVLESYQMSLATYIIADKPSPKGGSSARYLRADWVWDSLKQKKQLPIEKYLLS